MLTFTPESRAIYAPGGSLLGEGEIFRNPALAETLEELARTGPQSIGPGGWLSERIVEGLASTGGLVTAADMADYRVVERPPLAVAFRGHTIITNPPPSSGGVLIAAALSYVAARPVAAGAVSRYRDLVDAGEFANALRTAAFARRLHELDGADVTDWAVPPPATAPPLTRGRTPPPVGVIDRDGMIA